MTQEIEKSEDLLSALMDGQLRGQEFASTLDWLGQDAEARLTWHAYHLVGDVLRSGESVVTARDADFLPRLRVRLEQAVPLAPCAGVVDLMTDQRIAGRSTNDRQGHWKLLVGFASLAVVIVVGWQLAGGLTDHGGAQQAMIRDPQLDALLAAHRQSGGASALQMSAGFLRNATFEGSNR